MIIALQTLIFFRNSLIFVIDKFLSPYYKKLRFSFSENDIGDDDDDADDNVYAEFHDEKGVVFFPPVYAQRYAAVVDCLMDERWCGKLGKVVDFGYNDMSFIKYLKDVPGIQHVLGVDIETIPLRCSSDLLTCNNYVPKRESPLQVTLFKGNAADPDYRLIGCDAVVSIEMIEHMLPHDLERFIHTVFGFIKPRVAIFTTPNGDFNILFKALEENGLRRLDHFFEWSREQFHDWCSNIVSRYPQYTVVSKGIGPGPPGTQHLGCCSQLAMFIAKNYQKQPDLDLNSLALVAKAPSPNNISDLSDSWESPDSNFDDILCIENNINSYTKLPTNQSYMTIIFTSPTFSYETLECQDKILQCNLDVEFGKNFLMFDDEIHFNVLKPRRKKLYKVYEIEDVACRLNCSTVQVKKFSKISQGLMAKNKTDCFAHSKEVVEEIRQLTKMLNFNQSRDRVEGHNIWCNINWGDNAPYWNQYYKVVREYNYPFEVKTDETRILDAISEEINRLIDSEEDVQFSENQEKLHIPIEHLMSVVEHITTDVDKVKDLLEWNGYEVVDDVVIYSRLVIDGLSVNTQEEWTDDVTDWDKTDVRTTTLSEYSMNVPECYDRCLRRALETKIRNLRTLLTSDEDITTELDRIVCRLMKLALNTSKGSGDPPPSSWMQCKLFDLLTLTERAIEKRRRHFLESYTLKAIDNFGQEINSKNKVTLNAGDNTVKELVSKYYELITPTDFEKNNKLQDDLLSDYEFEDLFSMTSQDQNELQEHGDEYDDVRSDHEIKDDMENISLQDTTDKVHVKTTTLEQRQELKCHNYKSNVIPYPGYFLNLGDSTLKDVCVYDISKANNESNRSVHKVIKKINEHRHKSLKKKFYKKVTARITSKQTKTKKRKSKDYQTLQSKLSKPIPDSLIELCNPERHGKKDIKDSLHNWTSTNFKYTEDLYKLSDIAATEESLFISIVTEYGEETVALRRNIGISPEMDLDVEKETALETVINVTKDDDSLVQINVDPEKVASQTIFVYDIDQPSTSKGFQHLSTDAQCGPDVSLTCATISATTSLTAVPNIFSNCVQYEGSLTQIRKKTSDFGTGTEKMDNVPKTSIGIKIKDSDIDLLAKVKRSLMTQVSSDDFDFMHHVSCQKEANLQKPPSCVLTNEDSCSGHCSTLNLHQSPTQLISPINSSDIQIFSMTKDENIIAKKFKNNYICQNLMYGGIHVHSFREKSVSEDIVYQGEWQRSRLVQRKRSPDSCSRRSRSPLKRRKLSTSVHTSTMSTIKNLESYRHEKHSISPVVRRFKLNKNTTKKMSNNKHDIVENTFKKKPTVKATPLLITSLRKPKSAKSLYRKKPAIETSHMNNKKEESKKHKKKNYIPTYLRRRIIQLSNENNSLNNNISDMVASCKAKTRTFSMAEEIIKDLLNFTENMRFKNKCLVFCNENETKVSVEAPLSIATETVVSNSTNRNVSPLSRHSHSSTCSSPNSVATVRAAFGRNTRIPHWRDLPSSGISSSGFVNEIENKIKSKTYSKRYKSNKKSPNKVVGNKENIPETSKNVKHHKNDIQNNSKGTISGKPTEAYILQTTTDNLKLKSTLTTCIRNEAEKSITKINNNDTEKNLSSSNASDFYNIINCFPDLSENQQGCTNNRATSFSICTAVESEIDTSIVTSNSDKKSNTKVESPKKSVHNSKSSLMSAIRQLIEEKIHIAENASHESLISGSETVILNRSDIYNSSLNESLSPVSINTVIANEDSENSAIENAFVSFSSLDKNISVLSCDNVEPQITELDSISFTSNDLLSASTSKFSEYYLADNELDSTVLPQIDSLNINSVQELFERRDRIDVPNVNGLASQAFSGFSINAGSYVGDRPDNINLVDSETGSLTLDSARQAASEEVFVSGRSSDTYETCFLEDDTYVPSWLFNVISQQQSIDESENENDVLPMPLEDTVFDANGNVMEPEVAVGAGAGDGRGMHSDRSQDSSGRGTSLSSSATSSGQNEAVLIDFSAITSHRVDDSDGTVAAHGVGTVNEEINELNRTIEGNFVGELNRSAGTYVVQLTSDIDADVSSFDTDAVDSDD